MHKSLILAIQSTQCATQFRMRHRTIRLLSHNGAKHLDRLRSLAEPVLGRPKPQHCIHIAGRD